jgi:MinD superfamily P-loop ATPase
MSFDFDPTEDDLPSFPEVDKIDRQENANDKAAAKRPIVRIDYDLCDETGACAQVCPEDVFESRDSQVQVLKPDACTECWICVENCVSGAIDIG